MIWVFCYLQEQDLKQHMLWCIPPTLQGHGSHEKTFQAHHIANLALAWFWKLTELPSLSGTGESTCLSNESLDPSTKVDGALKGLETGWASGVWNCSPSTSPCECPQCWGACRLPGISFPNLLALIIQIFSTF